MKKILLSAVFVLFAVAQSNAHHGERSDLWSGYKRLQTYVDQNPNKNTKGCDTKPFINLTKDIANGVPPEVSLPLFRKLYQRKLGQMDAETAYALTYRIFLDRLHHSQLAFPEWQKQSYTELSRVKSGFRFTRTEEEIIITVRMACEMTRVKN